MYGPKERNQGIIADKADLSSSTSRAAYINSMYLKLKTIHSVLTTVRTERSFGFVCRLKRRKNTVESGNSKQCSTKSMMAEEN